MGRGGERRTVYARKSIKEHQMQLFEMKQNHVAAIAKAETSSPPRKPAIVPLPLRKALK